MDCLGASRSGPHAYSGFLWESVGAATDLPLLLCLWKLPQCGLMFWVALWLGCASLFQIETQDEVGPVQEHVFGPLLSGNLFSIGLCHWQALTTSLGSSRLDSLGIGYPALSFTRFFTRLPTGCGSEFFLSSRPLSPLHLWLPWPQGSWASLKPAVVL